MKFTLAWLKEHLETDADLAAITFALTDLGLEVEGVTNPADRLAAFTVGEVLEAAPHPDADKLRVCRVATARRREADRLRRPERAARHQGRGRRPGRLRSPASTPRSRSAGSAASRATA